MALPTLTYSDWRFNVNNDLNTPGTVLGLMRLVLFTVKSVLTSSSGWTDSSGSSTTLTSPWTVVSSSDASTAGTGDRWLSSSNLVWGAGGASSWIVLRQTGITGSAVEICIACNPGTSTPQWISLVVSGSAGFTGGSTTARPTATDELVLITPTADWSVSTSVDMVVHVMMANDGEITRVFFMSSSAVRSIWQFEKLNSPVTGWSPAVFTGVTKAAAPTYALRNAAAGAYCLYNDSSKKYFPAYQTVETHGGGPFGSRVTVINDLTSEWPLLPIRAFSSGTYPFGVIGDVADNWWTSTGLATGDTFPASGTTKQFIKLGDQVFPWNQSSPLLA